MNLSRSLNVTLDKIQLSFFDAATRDEPSVDSTEDLKKLQDVIRSLETPPKLAKLSSVLSTYEFSSSADDCTQSEWLALAKTSVVVLTSLMEELFARSNPLSHDIMYWEQLLASRIWRYLYTAQTMPRRVWDFANALFIKLKIQFQSGSFTLGTLRHSVFDRALLRQVSFPHLAHIHSSRTTRFLSFDSMIRQEIRARIARLIKLRDAQAQAIGLIVTKARIQNAEDLPRDTSFLIDIMELSVLHSSFSKEDYSTEDLDIEEEQTLQCPNNLATRLTKLSSTFGRNRASFEKRYHQYSRPSRIVRYWPVCVSAYIIGSTASKYVWNRRQDITTWLGEMVQTVESFWLNWIVEPTRNILATIRHDAGSEVALLSSRSLGADLDSLERMVVEFAKDNPQFSNNMSLEALKLSARNGDVTPVLVAYEDNIKSPLRSAITGSLIRALLIQIQKTKVDVEVAINGIDKLLKSQELVFGFIGVSPALAFVWVVLQWSSSVGGRRGKTSSGQLKLNTIKTLRNVDRLLCKSHDEIMLTYKERGLILCEAQILRSGANCIVTGLRDQYLQDLEDLESASTLRVTRSVLNRILSVYSGSLIYP